MNAATVAGIVGVIGLSLAAYGMGFMLRGAYEEFRIYRRNMKARRNK